MRINCKVGAIEVLTSYTYKIQLLPEQTIEFKAGQYLMVVMDDKDSRPFSIANRPSSQQKELELHIGGAQQSDYAMAVIDKMKEALDSDGYITIEAPYGEAWVREPSERPLLLIAGGTGFTYIHSILEQCIYQQRTQPIFLYWGVREPKQLYAYQKLKKLEQQHDNLTITAIVEDGEKGWESKTGNVLQAVCDDFESLEAFEVYIAGRFEMAKVARDTFIRSKKLNEEYLYGDAFNYI